MKKFFAFLVILSIVISSTACGNTSTSDGDPAETELNGDVNIESSNEETDNEETGNEEPDPIFEYEEIEFDPSILTQDEMAHIESSSGYGSSDGYTEGEFIYTLSANETYAILLKYLGDNSEVKVPSALGGKPVVIIDEKAFEYCKDTLTKVSLPHTVMSLDYYVFRDCINLETVELSCPYLMTIQAEVFRNCTSLTSISIPNSVSRIDSAIFEDCTNLTTVSFENNECELGSDIFRGCSSIDLQSLPSNLRANAFCTIVIDIFHQNSGESNETIMEIYKNLFEENNGYFTYGDPVEGDGWFLDAERDEYKTEWLIFKETGLGDRVELRLRNMEDIEDTNIKILEGCDLVGGITSEFGIILLDSRDGYAEVSSYWAQDWAETIRFEIERYETACGWSWDYETETEAGQAIVVIYSK